MKSINYYIEEGERLEHDAKVIREMFKDNARELAFYEPLIAMGINPLDKNGKLRTKNALSFRKWEIKRMRSQAN